MIVLFIRARLENVAKISLPLGHTYTLTVKDSTGETTREGVTVTSSHEEELPGSKGTANFALKWARDSKHVASLNVKEIEKELKVKSKEKIKGCYTAEDEGSFVGIVAFECRGMDVTGWQPEDGFIVESTSGARFEDVDLSEKEWMDYDEKLGESIGIYDLEYKLQGVKV
ncbi:probable CXXC motif containing zinc binding protein [Coccomyxa sp. Obi]|nr:probable CXXC motif containing zinc binding protein [Coccomyxa sp. Obi]